MTPMTPNDPKIDFWPPKKIEGLKLMHLYE